MDKTMNLLSETGGTVRAVGYIRTATAGAEAEAAAEHQKATIKAFAEERGVKIVDWYVDLGYSAHNLERPGLRALLAVAQEPDHGIGMALVSDEARLARSLKDVREITTTLSDSGISLVSVTDPCSGPTTEKLVHSINEGVASYLKDAHAKDTRQGLRVGAQRGYWVSSKAPYGYRKVEVNDGGRRRYKLEIDPETAKVVRVMYDRDGQGASPQAIATELNDEGVPSPTGGPWTGPQVRRVLCNLANAGIVVVGKNSDEPVTVRDAHPAIVSEAVVEKAKQLPKQVASQ